MILRGATALVHATMGLAMRDPNTVTCAYLREPVSQLSDSQCVITEPGPLLEAVGAVLEAGRGIPTLPHREAMSDWERAVWEALDELSACYERDRAEIEIAHEVKATVEQLSAGPR